MERTNLEVNLNERKNRPDVIKIKPDVKQKEEPEIKSNKEHKQDVKPKIEFDKESKPDTNKITYEEENVALVLGITSIFTEWWMFK